MRTTIALMLLTTLLLGGCEKAVREARGSRPSDDSQITAASFSAASTTSGAVSAPRS
jgi:hypothetical protein